MGLNDSIMNEVAGKVALASLTDEQRARYYLEVCAYVGLNPITRPFEYVYLKGRLVLYATRTAADQLRANHQISIDVISNVIEGDCAVVQVRGLMPDGRSDEDYGIVTVKGLSSEAAAFARLHAVTKAKRRVTLALCGLGWLDEGEMATAFDQSGANTPPAPSKPSIELVPPEDAEKIANDEARLRWRQVRNHARSLQIASGDIAKHLEELRELRTLTNHDIYEAAERLEERIKIRQQEDEAF